MKMKLENCQYKTHDNNIINYYGTVHYLPKFEKPEIHLKHLKTSYTSQKLGLTFFKDYGLVKPRLHQTGQ